MTDAHTDSDVLVVGAGPVGLTAALELRRRGIDVTVVDRSAEPMQYAKAVGVQPRTLEIWDTMGVVRPALDAATPFRGQLMFVDGEPAGRIDLSLPDDVPYRFVALPQNETERVLRQALADHGTVVRRGVELTGFTHDDTGVVATLRDGSGASSPFTARYLVGCDGAHSTVRKGLGLEFEGDAFPEEYMLADVEVDWSLPEGYAVRSTRQDNGVVTDLLVCIPLPGTGRYRMSMLAADDLAVGARSGEVAHGLESSRRPELGHIQAVLDRLAPEPVRARNMRWSSVFRISHRIAAHYGSGRVFLAGDAAHIHPPTGAQGMNTGIQDAYNLGWKLALAVRDRAADGLLDSYDAERRPVGADVVGRTVRAARSGIGAGEQDAATIIAREAQLLVGYPGSPIVDTSGSDGRAPAPGERAPDATGLRQDSVARDLRVHELFRHTGHTVLLWAPTEPALAATSELAARLIERFGEWMRVYTLVPSDLPAPACGRVLRDSLGSFARGYHLDGTAAVVVRPDGYVGSRAQDPDFDTLEAYLDRILRA
ncbi:FAD-dependent oxidoreductase [Rhodococcus sp. NPDC003382]